MRVAWFCVLALLLGGAAQAHAHLERSVPADGSVLHAAPAQLVLAFSEPGRLTALWIEDAAGKRRKVEVLPEVSARELTVTLPLLAPGRYAIGWRVLSADGHVMPGRIRFTIMK
ncbi:MAG TPA: copper resistance CopC family protein [Steroidobacteraceae bacterium]|nr:copper resistance CopC family protein [Steroidobacteraceae bacterium]